MKILNSFHLKIIAIITMTIDHIGFIYSLDAIYRIIGRISFPIFAFLIAEGAYYTKSRMKYFVRLILFAFLIHGSLLIINSYIIEVDILFNIFFTLAAGLLLIIIYDSKFNIYLKYIISTLIVLIAYSLNFDYSFFGPPLILLFYVFRKNKPLMIVSSAVFMIIYAFSKFDNVSVYAVMSLPFLLLYNGKQGLKVKYLFYIYYPLHLGILYLLSMYI